MRSTLFIVSFLYLALTVVSASFPVLTSPKDSLVARHATPESLSSQSNAQRLARGLPPKAPRRLYSPTRVRRDPLPSSAATVTANIRAVYKSSGSLAGYLKQGGVLSSSSQTYRFSTPSSSSTMMRMEVTELSGKYMVLKFADSSPTTYYIGPGSARTLSWIASGTAYPAGSVGPVPFTTGSSIYFEMYVWSVDLATGALSVWWTNSDGSTVQVYFLVDPNASTKSITIVGDVAAYKAANPSMSYLQEVTFVGAL